MKKEIKENPDDRNLSLSIRMPYQFYMLCKLIEINPIEIIFDFMRNVGVDHQSMGELQRNKAIEYFLSCKYGHSHYSEEEIKRMFKEMGYLVALFPEENDSKLIDLYAAWKERHQSFWFDRWFFRARRSKK
ncbi:MAG: hypothetical protein E6Q24_20100 [Chitinophagaceae bacterium]|nr:MAG: hypothetical protein E6Q24_20100 [Chitinophagaceae bacterium]